MKLIWGTSNTKHKKTNIVVYVFGNKIYNKNEPINMQIEILWFVNLCTISSYSANPTPSKQTKIIFENSKLSINTAE